MSRTMLIGGAGFIGTNLLHALSDRPVSIFDNFTRGDRRNIPNHVDVIEGDIRDTAMLREAMSGVSAVVHLAAYGSVIESIDDPTSNFDINARGTQNVLDACRLNKVERVVFASTGGALIGNTKPPVDETSLPKPISPYGASKLCGEAYCHAYASSYGMRTIALRFANIYGPYSGHKKGAVTRFMKAVLDGETITIYGDGSATRDYLYVNDLCRGIKRALDMDISPGAVFHLASGVETSVSELSALICEVAGRRDHPVVHLASRRGEVERNFARFDKARREMGFQPEVTLRDGIVKTWKWFEKNRDVILDARESES